MKNKLSFYLILLFICISIITVTILQLDFSYKIPKTDINTKLTNDEIKTAITPYLNEMNKINEKYGTKFNLPDKNFEEFYNYIKINNESIKDFRKRYIGYYKQYKNIDFYNNTIMHDATNNITK